MAAELALASWGMTTPFPSIKVFSHIYSQYATRFSSNLKTKSGIAKLTKEVACANWVWVVRKRFDVGEDCQELAHARRDELALAYFW
jgi:hypothetical protein